MNKRDSFVFQDVGYLAEVFVEIRQTDMFQHTDAHYAVEPVGDIAIILQPKIAKIRHPRRLGPRHCCLVLVFRQRDAGDLCAMIPRKRQGHTAPAASNVEHMSVSARTIASSTGQTTPLT